MAKLDDDKLQVSLPFQWRIVATSPTHLATGATGAPRTPSKPNTDPGLAEYISKL